MFFLSKFPHHFPWVWFPRPGTPWDVSVLPPIRNAIVFLYTSKMRISLTFLEMRHSINRCRHRCRCGMIHLRLLLETRIAQFFLYFFWYWHSNTVSWFFSVRTVSVCYLFFCVLFVCVAHLNLQGGLVVDPMFWQIDSKTCSSTSSNIYIEIIQFWVQTQISSQLFRWSQIGSSNYKYFKISDSIKLSSWFVYLTTYCQLSSYILTIFYKFTPCILNKLLSI